MARSFWELRASLVALSELVLVQALEIIKFLGISRSELSLAFAGESAIDSEAGVSILSRALAFRASG